MRIRTLEIEGFGPYKQRQLVDFDRFAGDGLFLITGKTGAGKSSILDAICFALYGSVPRYDGTESNLRSDHCADDDPTRVELVFTVHDTDYRLSRSPAYDRPKKRGVGMALEKATAELAVRRDDHWEGVAAIPAQVGPEVLRIVGLTKDQFLQVILLAQNRFQEFLLAKNDDRQKVLRSLFGTHRFLDIETALVDQRKALEVRLAAAREAIAVDAAHAAALLGVSEAGGGLDEPDSSAGGTGVAGTSIPTPLDPDLPWFEQGLAAMTDRLLAATDAVARADAEFTAADVAHRALERTREQQDRRDDARLRLAELEAERDTVALDREALDLARHAAAATPQVTARRTAAAALDSARAIEAVAGEGYHGRFADDHSPSTGDLRAEIDDLRQTLGTLSDALDDEAALPALTAATGTLQRGRDDLATEVAEREARARSLPAELEEIRSRLGEAKGLAATAPDAAERVERLTAAEKAASTVDGLEPKLAAALAIATAASGEAAASATLVHDLMTQRLSGHAAELAGQLREGEACSVCGSAEHPAPATFDGAPVTPEDIERARTAAAARQADLDAAHEATTDLDRRVAEARAAAGGKASDQLRVELAEARDRLAVAVAAATDSRELELELARLTTELADATTALDRIRSDRDDAERQLVESHTRCSSLEARIATHRGDFDSVAARSAQLRQQLDAASALADAIAAVSARLETLDTATTAVREVLDEHGFADESSVVDARRDVDVVAAIQARIRRFDDALAAAAATLAEPAITAVPDDAVELLPAEAARDAAAAARDASLATSTALGTRVEQLGTIVASARRRIAASGALLDEQRQLRELANAVEGKEPNDKRMRLETYVLAARLEEIVAAANARLRTMTSGRYALEHDDAIAYRNVQSGLGLAIRDEHSGRARATHSLSGGETFLASLALALGLAEVVQNQAGGIRLDTLFIDEGFGSLDGDTLEIAMSTLDSLRAGGRTIGLISHVEAMKEQITAHLEITVSGNGWSEIAEARAFA
ncbi:exonuclease SbcC [Marisediminicola sp. UYEF4]|uniref:SMC family ATPase n=1 Tax=Marisediminicola sp. UYEF4 TaxID=1756384 RepID=UPI0033996B82